MKKLIFIFLLFGLMPVLGMERQGKGVDGIDQFFTRGSKRFDADMVIEALTEVCEVSKRAEEAELLKEYVKIETSDGCEYVFTRRDLHHLQSELLNKFWQTDDVCDFTRPLVNCDAQTLNKILELVEARDRNEILASLSESEIEVLIMALDELQMPLCDAVCKWIADKYEISRFDGKNLFPRLINDKEERCCYPLQKALVKKLCSTEFGLKQMNTELVPLEGHVDWVTSVAVSSDNSFIVTASDDRKAKIWRLNENHRFINEEPITFVGHTGGINSVAIASDNSFVVTGSRDNTAKIWRLNKNYMFADEEPITLEGHTSLICSVAIASDNSFIVTGSGDNTAKIWRLNKDHTIADEEPITLEGHTSWVYSVAISSDNSFIVTGSSDNTAKIWRLNKDYKPFGFTIDLVGHRSEVSSVAISSDNSFIVTGSGDNTAKIWRLNKDHKPVGFTIDLVGHCSEVRSVAISSNNSFIVTGSEDCTAKIWRLNKDHERIGEPITLAEHKGLVQSVAIAADNSFIVTGSRDNTAKIWLNLEELDALKLDLAQILVLLKIATFPSRIILATPDFYAIYESLPDNLKRIVDE